MSKPLDFSTQLAKPSVSVEMRLWNPRQTRHWQPGSATTHKPREEKNGSWNNGNRCEQGQYLSLKLQILFQKLTHTHASNPSNKLRNWNWGKEISNEGFSDGPRTCCNYYIIFSRCDHETILSVMHLFEWVPSLHPSQLSIFSQPLPHPMWYKTLWTKSQPPSVWEMSRIYFPGSWVCRELKCFQEHSTKNVITSFLIEKRKRRKELEEEENSSKLTWLFVSKDLIKSHTKDSTELSNFSLAKSPISSILLLIRFNKYSLYL